MNASGHPVVVGVDGSTQSWQAAAWAGTEAGFRRAPLHIVLVNDDPARADYAEKVVDEIATHCRGASPQLEVTEEVAAGRPIEDLVRRSADAQLMVLGSRGHGSFMATLIGSVSFTVAKHGACPVVVVRGDGASATGPVVVGVDLSPSSDAAVDFAYQAAARRGTDLIAVQALPDAYFGPDPFSYPDREETYQQTDLHLAEQLAGWADKHPGVRTRKAITSKHPVEALRDFAHDAQLVVVGHRGRGGFAGMLLGSVASGVLHHAPCPVAVVRATKQ